MSGSLSMYDPWGAAALPGALPPWMQKPVPVPAPQAAPVALQPPALAEPTPPPQATLQGALSPPPAPPPQAPVAVEQPALQAPAMPQPEPQGDAQGLLARLRAEQAPQPAPEPTAPARPAPVAMPNPGAAPQAGNSDPYVSMVVSRESGGRADAKNPNSSATGLGQFIEGTWLDLLSRRRPDLVAGKSRAEILALRTDPALSAEMIGALGEENGAALQAAGLPAGPTEKYLAHFAGAGDAIKLLRADPNAPIEQVMEPASIAANRSILAGKTVGQVLAWNASEAARRGSGGSGGAPGATPAAPGASPAPGGSQAILAGLPALSTDAPPPIPLPEQGPLDLPAQPGGVLGQSADSWFSLASGLFGGKNLQDGLSKGLGNFAQQRGADRAEALRRGSEAERRAVTRTQLQMTDRQQQIALANQRDNQILNRAQLAISGRQADIAERRVDAVLANTAGGNVQSTQQLSDPTTGQAYTRVQKRDGSSVLTDAAGNVVPLTPELGGRLVARQDSGTGARANAEGTAQGKDDVEEGVAMSDAARNARNRLTDIGNARTLIQREGVVTGGQVAKEIRNRIVQWTGLDVGDLTSEGLSLGAQTIERLQQGDIRGMLAGQGAVSEWERKNAAQALLNMRTDPKAAGVLLDIMERRANREIALNTEFRDLSEPERVAIRRSTGGVRAWRDKRADQIADLSPLAVQPTAAAPAGAASAQPNYQLRTPSGVGFSFTM